MCAAWNSDGWPRTQWVSRFLAGLVTILLLGVRQAPNWGQSVYGPPSGWTGSEEIAVRSIGVRADAPRQTRAVGVGVADEAAAAHGAQFAILLGAAS